MVPLRDDVKKYLESDRPQMTIWGTRIAFWITKATNVNSEYAILIASAQQQWLHDSASLLRYSTGPLLLIWTRICKLEVQEFMLNISPNKSVLLENWQALVTIYSKNFFHILIKVAFGGSWKYLQRTVMLCYFSLLRCVVLRRYIQ